MPSVLGKRKSRSSDEESAAARAKALAAFQQHFESQFKPLPESRGQNARTRADAVSAEEDEEDDETETDATESDSEWGGVSDDEGEDQGSLNVDDGDEPPVTVVDHSTSDPTSAPVMKKQETKKFMSSRPPTSDLPASHSRDKKTKNSTGVEDEDSAQFLAKDLELQRLISESHILSAAGGNPAYYTSARGGPASSAGPQELFTAGRVRRLTTDMRLRALGAKGSIVEEGGKMPMAKRKGLAAAKAEREDRRRREAKENGIVLEKPAAKKRREPAKTRHGELRVDLPGVGKMRGAELRISSRDIRAVAQSVRPPGGTKGRRGRRR